MADSWGMVSQEETQIIDLSKLTADEREAILIDLFTSPITLPE